MEPEARRGVSGAPADAGSNRPSRDPPLEPDPAGIGPDGGTTFTIYFPTDGGYRGADLAHPAPLPRVGDRVDYIDETGVSHRYRVRDVVHTFQAAPSTRPSVREASEASEPSEANEAGEATRASSEGLARAAGTPAAASSPVNTAPRSIPESPELRGGLPEVFLELADDPG